MPRLTLALVVLVVAAACSEPVAEDVATSTETSPPTTIAATSTTGRPTTTTTLPSGPPVGWYAPSGVPLAVTMANGEVVEVITPCGNPETLTEGEPIHEVDVVIDPGHGGPVDTGAVGPTGLAEKEINLRVSLAVKGLLEERGIQAVLTRVGDYPVPIRTRVEYARLMGAQALVSIHHNAPAAPASDIPGVEVFVKNGSTESQRLGGLIYDASMAALAPLEVDWDRSPDAGVMTVLNTEGDDAYGMVRLPEMPSALVELGYISNRAEAELYQTTEYVTAAAGSVADAVEVFLTSDDTGASLVEGRVFNPNRGVGRDQCIEPDLEAALYPDVLAAEVSRGSQTYGFEVTISSPYDSAERYADAFRIVGDDGQVYGIRELLHDHANEQPFTRSLGGLDIPDSVESVTIEARDLVYGWGGATVEVALP
ncbi:MAG TPA: N-acetylmuramoyl-L-alanine amidase [Acidimicrobiia bacterium]